MMSSGDGHQPTEPTGDNRASEESRPVGGGELLRVEGLEKRYGETRALRGIDFVASAGEVHAIVGENGAGKSTMMKVLAGAVRPDAGEIRLAGEPVQMDAPLDARQHGIWAVYQEFSLVPHLTVRENLLLGRMAGGQRWLVRPRQVHAEAQQMLDQLGFTVDLARRVDRLSVSQRQMVEIAKALAERPRILILDEPSAVLAREELELVFGLVRQLVAEGSLVLYVSHRLDEIFEIADRITVFKDGERVVTLRPSDTDQRQLINLMVGRDVDDVFPDRTPPSPGALLEVKELSRPPSFRDISFRLGAGEVVGVFGLVGSGRTELARAMFGAEPATSGSMLLDGAPYAPSTPRAALDSGIAYLTEDRGRDGLVYTEPVRSNMTLAVLRDHASQGFFRPRTEKVLAGVQMRALAVRAPSVETPVTHLSGGNQQKVLLARCLLTGARVLILDEPTRGVDVATKIQIYRTIATLAEEGKAILVISSELVEILGVADRILVMREGRVVAEVPGAEATESSLLAAASGVAL
jgi:ribose transport system ATP-binding protein